MFFVEATYRVKCIMKFISIDAGITGFVQVSNKLIHQIEKCIFMHIAIFPVEPMDNISPEFFIMIYLDVPGAGCRELIGCIKL